MEVEKVKKEIADRFSAFQKEINETIDSLAGEKAALKPEKDKWYCGECHDNATFVCKHNGELSDGKFFHTEFLPLRGEFLGSKTQGRDWSASSLIKRPATPSEVQEALVKEAEKRGFKEGVKFKSITIGEVGKVRPYSPYVTLGGKQNKTIDLSYLESSDSLYCNNGLDTCRGDFCSNPCIYEKGVWAEIVKDETIKIGGYEVLFYKDYTTIDGYTFTKAFWQACETVARHSKAKIMIGCSHQFDLPLSTIEAILKRL